MVTDPAKEYGLPLALLLSLVRLLPLLALPQVAFTLAGLVRFPAFPPQRVSLASSPLLAPFVCVRVVTRGLYPRLVRETVKKNLEAMAAVGFENYVVQVVTDTPVNVAGE